ncbi:hypothetical protein [Tunturiibacter lichenicola]|uniref:hypothetical protein n=1 Tax=Tunturiibacter lichenicola TaxID=2051959 RepID=UPI0021B2478E|nr:hypothetical protein [Edaphobacter lichenicola]
MNIVRILGRRHLEGTISEGYFNDVKPYVCSALHVPAEVMEEFTTSTPPGAEQRGMRAGDLVRPT